jgi:hemoglobin-like flavoprotein
MDEQVIGDVQSSWKVVEGIAPQAAALFYSNLFEADPSLRALFRGDMDEQGRKLMQMIGAAVGKLTDLDSLVPVLQGLARRHLDYGVEESHYGTVGGALLKTLEQELGAAFTPGVKASWTAVYDSVSTVMISASKTAE